MVPKAAATIMDSAGAFKRKATTTSKPGLQLAMTMFRTRIWSARFSAVETPSNMIESVIATAMATRLIGHAPRSKVCTSGESAPRLIQAIQLAAVAETEPTTRAVDTLDDH